MSRPTTPLTADQAERAVAYLQRAMVRGAELFSTALKVTQRSLAQLRRRGLTLRRPDFAAEANDWLDRHLTPEGRRKMLAALRQERIEGKRELHSIRISGATHVELSALAERKGLSLSETVALLVSTAGAEQR